MCSGSVRYTECIDISIPTYRVSIRHVNSTDELAKRRISTWLAVCPLDFDFTFKTNSFVVMLWLSFLCTKEHKEMENEFSSPSNMNIFFEIV